MGSVYHINNAAHSKSVLKIGNEGQFAWKKSIWICVSLHPCIMAISVNYAFNGTICVFAGVYFSANVQHSVSVEIHLSASSALTVPHTPGYR